MSKTILSVMAHPKLTTILIGIAVTAAISAVSGLQYAHAQHLCGIGSGNGGLGPGNGGIIACNANGAAPGNGGFIPGHSTGATETGKASGITPHQCTVGLCVS
jgi:hypothetical protein